jgi:hypothetical protein
MPFHVGGHKPKPPARKFAFSIKYRLLVAATGAALIWTGLFRLEHGMFMWEGALYHQPHSAVAQITLGGAVILVSLLPVSWADRIAKRHTSRAPKSN